MQSILKTKPLGQCFFLCLKFYRHESATERNPLKSAILIDVRSESDGLNFLFVVLSLKIIQNFYIYALKSHHS
jgi:hypothetical protein